MKNEKKGLEDVEYDSNFPNFLLSFQFGKDQKSGTRNCLMMSQSVLELRLIHGKR